MASPVGNTGIAFSRLWHLADAKGQILGKFSHGVATALAGIHKPIYNASYDCGDYVVVINAKYITVSGDKLESKIYHSHSGYPGGKKEVPLWKLREKNPQKVIKSAVQGMLPRNQLRRERLDRLLIFPEEDHPFKENIARFYEYPELEKINPRQWTKMTGEELRNYHDHLIKLKLKDLLH